MNTKSSTKTETEAAAIKTRQFHRATIACHQASRQCAAHFRRTPAFAPLHRFINCLVAEASDRRE